MDLQQLQHQLAQVKQNAAPVDLWDPPYCGPIPLCIKHDGSWWYQGTPIGRIKLVKLFASVLKKQQDAYFLVTPVEKVLIEVEDSPFIITQWQQENGRLLLETSLGDTVAVGPENPLELLQDKITSTSLPYVLVRKNLYARLHQNVYYQLIEQAYEGTLDESNHLLIKSQNHEYSLGKL